MPSTEAGLRNHRVEWVEGTEDASGDEQAPANPSWNLFSDRVRSFEWDGDPGVEQARGLGDADPENEKTVEEHSLTVTYDLQQSLVSGGNPQDAAAYGVMRDADNYLHGHHTVVARQELGSVVAGETVNGSTAKDGRLYTVMTGGYVDEVTLSGDPGSQGPIAVELTYEAVMVRSYRVDQPGSSTALDVASSDAGDDSQTVVIEDDSGATEDVSLNGTTTVTTTKTDWTSIDAIYVTDGSGNPADHDGTITVSESGSDDLATIAGTTDYDGQDSDYGIPATGTGSHASAIGGSYEKFIGDTIERPAGTNLAYDVNSLELSVSNNTERTIREDSFAQRVHVGGRDTEVTATVVGPVESHEAVMDAVQTVKNDLVWTLTNTTITVTNATVTDPGSRAPDAGQAAMTLDNTFTGEGVTLA